MRRVPFQPVINVINPEVPQLKEIIQERKSVFVSNPVRIEREDEEAIKSFKVRRRLQKSEIERNEEYLRQTAEERKVHGDNSIYWDLFDENGYANRRLLEKYNKRKQREIEERRKKKDKEFMKEIEKEIREEMEDYEGKTVVLSYTGKLLEDSGFRRELTDEEKNARIDEWIEVNKEWQNRRLEDILQITEIEKKPKMKEIQIK